MTEVVDSQRLARIEGDLAALKEPIDNLPQPPRLRQFSSALAEKHEQARQERVKAAAAAAEQAARQAKKDAPRRAKRERALQALDDQIQAEETRHDETIRQLNAERAELNRRRL